MKVCSKCKKEVKQPFRLTCPDCSEELLKNIEPHQINVIDDVSLIYQATKDSQGTNYLHELSSFYKNQDLLSDMVSFLNGVNAKTFQMELMKAIFGVYSFPFKELHHTFNSSDLKTIANFISKRRSMEIEDIGNTLNQILTAGFDSYYNENQIAIEKKFFEERSQFKAQLRPLLDDPIKPRKDILNLNWVEKSISLFSAKHEKEYKARRAEAYNESRRSYKSKLQACNKFNAEIGESNKGIIEKLKGLDKREEFEINALQNRKNVIKQGYDNNVECYIENFLTYSPYPDQFKKKKEVVYDADNRVLMLNYWLPEMDDLPKAESYNFVMSRYEFTEKAIPKKKLNELYDSLIYQICLRTIYEVFQFDIENNLIDSVVFNGRLNFDDPRLGNRADICLISIRVSKEELAKVNLSRVKPKECFKALKGIGSSKLFAYAAVAPVVEFNKKDKRFIAPEPSALEASQNLAAMDWQDFEHLIRELFEREYSSDGAEVKITRASRDEGVDAVVFDPDPIKGGKIIIQAKRYTNTVGIAAVRDLYGAVINEGANKGILVTTTDFGPDAYTFVKDKPITLLNGANLLYLLERHGYKARIDLKEAKQILSAGNSGDV